MKALYKYSSKVSVYALLLYTLTCFFRADYCFAENVELFPSQGSYQVGFSPRGQSLNVILNNINKSEQSILIAAYSFTSKPIAQALLEAKERGVRVMVIADAKSNRSRHSVLPQLADNGISVRLNNNYAILHHKFMVIDGQHIETGSFNYSVNAVNRNAENVLVILNMPELAKQYLEQWHKLWNEGTELGP